MSRKHPHRQLNRVTAPPAFPCIRSDKDVGGERGVPIRGRGEVGLDVVAGSIRKSKQFVRPRTVDLVERGLVEQTSGKPLRFRLTGQERESLGLSDEE
jgi:hypothetical protein